MPCDTVWNFTCGRRTRFVFPSPPATCRVRSVHASTFFLRLPFQALLCRHRPQYRSPPHLQHLPSSIAAFSTKLLSYLLGPCTFLRVSKSMQPGKQNHMPNPSASSQPLVSMLRRLTIGIDICQVQFGIKPYLIGNQSILGCGQKHKSIGFTLYSAGCCL